MPGLRSPELFANPEKSGGAFNGEVRADLHVGNPRLASYQEVEAAKVAKSFAESNQRSVEHIPTPHGVARILTLHIIHMRRKKQNEPTPVSAPQPPRQDDFNLAA